MTSERSHVGHVAVVTGAGSGIGRGLAKLLDEGGWRLALCDVDEAALEKTAGDLAGEVLAARVDVADRAAVEAFAADVEQRYGRVDLVVNNAGVDVSQTVRDTSYDDFEWLMNINFWGVVHGTKAFLPGMVERDAGTIVNVSSIFGIIAWPTHSAYVASKFAVRGFSESLRNELLGTGVRVLVVHPGGIDTDIVRRSRFYVDDVGRADKAASQRDFARMAPTSPDQAAAKILRAVERGQTKLLIGPDAQAADRLQRLAPVRYWRILQFFRRFAR
ncbi:MAG: short-chain dehydrogenase/reductase [Frankiales bacterium]|nr:short-chain dehydrogenase/reductase [Frankiales bacterium]